MAGEEGGDGMKGAGKKQGGEGFLILWAIQMSGTLPVVNHLVYDHSMGVKKQFLSRL